MKYNGTTATTTTTTTTMMTTNPANSITTEVSPADFLSQPCMTSSMINTECYLSSIKLISAHIYSEGETFSLHGNTIGAALADLGRVMNNACDKFASHACKRAPVIPLAVPFYRPIPWIQLSNSFHVAKYYSVIPYDHPCAMTSRRAWAIVRDPDISCARINVARHVN